MFICALWVDFMLPLSFATYSLLFIETVRLIRKQNVCVPLTRKQSDETDAVDLLLISLKKDEQWNKSNEFIFHVIFKLNLFVLSRIWHKFAKLPLDKLIPKSNTRVLRDLFRLYSRTHWSRVWDRNLLTKSYCRQLNLCKRYVVSGRCWPKKRHWSVRSPSAVCNIEFVTGLNGKERKAVRKNGKWQLVPSNEN